MLLEVGKFYKLEIIRESEYGLYLDALNLNEVLLPKKEVPKEYKIGEKLSVFLYRDTKDRLVATLKKPMAELDDVAYLKVADTTRVGAFLEWGLDKHLFLPFAEQKKRVEKDEYYVVKILLDDRDRLIASTIIDDFVDNTDHKVKEGDRVSALVYRITELGYLCIIENKHFGILYKNEVFRKLNVGDKLHVFVKKLRKDDKIDLRIDNPDVKRFDEFSEKVLAYLKEHQVLHLTDKSSPDDIYKAFAMSKKNFKKAIGALYKKRLIEIKEDQILYKKKENKKEKKKQTNKRKK